MKVMWIMNAPLCQGASLLGYGNSQSGTWIDASYDFLMRETSVFEVFFVFPGTTDRKAYSNDKKMVVYELSGVKSCRGKRDKKGAVDRWKKLINEIEPDLIHIWGSEFTFPLDVIEASGGAPCLISIQGVIQAIAKYSSLGMFSYRKKKGVGNPIEWLKTIKTYKSLNDIQKQVNYENEIIRRCCGIICDNEWSAAHYRANIPDVTVYYQPLAIANSFQEKKWDSVQMERYTIFTITGRTPLKGLHQLLHAMPIVKRKFNDIKLYIPGNFESRWPQLLFSLPYVNYLKRLIVEYDLFDNVIFTGQLNSKEMANRMCLSNVFVMPSCIENHSSTLREAMHIGCPSITSMVGGTYEFVEHNKNALIYRYEEYEVLANHIINVFANEDLARELGSSAQKSISLKYPQERIGKIFVDIYSDILKKFRKD